MEFTNEFEEEVHRVRVKALHTIMEAGTEANVVSVDIANAVGQACMETWQNKGFMDPFLETPKQMAKGDIKSEVFFQAYNSLQNAVDRSIGHKSPVGAFGSKMIPTPKLYEPFPLLTKWCIATKSMVLYSDDGEVLVLGGVNPVSLNKLTQVAKEEVSSSKKFSPFISYVILDTPTWAFLFKKHSALISTLGLA